jgi:dolichyl-phosphate-mannose-protein mannosyltransferase
MIPRKFTTIVSALALFLIGPAIAPGLRAAESAQVLLNGDFSKGSGDSPDHWRTEGWREAPTITTYKWIRPANGQPGQLEVDNLQPNDARWQQSLTLNPGWYHFSVELKADNVGAKETGASISVLEDGIISEDLKGTSDWRKVDFYLKVGSAGSDIDVALRVGGYASLNTGRAFFRNASVVPVDAPPKAAARVFDLSAIRKESQSPPVGQPWTLVATFLLLAIAAYIGWRIYGEAEVAAQHAQAAPPSSPQPKAGPSPGKKARRRR